VHVFAEPEAEHCASSVALPGTFRPEGRDDFLAVIAHVQGFVHKGKGPAFFKAYCSPTFLSMCMYGQLAARSGLLSIMETDPDAVMIWEKTEKGRINLQWVQQPSFGKLAYPRETVLVLTAPDITPLCKAYRKYEIEKKRFKSWDEKIAERPVLRKLFDSTTVCVGYHHDDGLDYAENFRALHKMGVKNARVLPVFMGTTVDFKFKEKGVPRKAVDLRKQIPLIRKLGGLPHGLHIHYSGFAGKNKDPYRDLMLDQDGKTQTQLGNGGQEVLSFNGAEEI